MSEILKEKTWLEVWLDNYNGVSDIAKKILGAKKQTYKGDDYLSWALMVGALYQMDPDAKIIKEQNETSGYVFTDTCFIKTIQAGVETTSTTLSHMVKVSIRFMNKTFSEVYPIQDKAYSALKVYDQNMVNKAQQRCLTRVISLATGIGWKLYEQTEAQFDDDKKPEVIKPALVEKTIVTPNVVETILSEGITPAIELAKLIADNKDNQALITLLGNYNAVLRTKYMDDKGEPVTLELTDDFDTLAHKIGFLESPEKMLKGLRKGAGL